MKKVYIVITEDKLNQPRIWATFTNKIDAEKCQESIMKNVTPYVSIHEENLFDNIDDYFGQ